MIAMLGGVCGWLSDENHSRKNQTDVFDYFGRDFRHPISPIAIAGLQICDIVSWD